MAAIEWMNYSRASSVVKQMILDGSHEPAVLDKAAAIIADLPPMAWVEEAQAIWAFVRSNIRYVDDPTGDDTFQAPTVTLRRRAGDCDDQVILLASLLRSIGFQARLVFVFASPPKDYTVDFPIHVYLEVNVDKLNQTKPLWVCVETIPLPNDHGGFYFPNFGESYSKGYREYLAID